MTYPVVLRRDDNGTVLVSFRDFPEAHTYGDDREEALARAREALATVIDAYIRDRRELPVPSKRRGPSVELSPIMEAKVALYRAMREQNVGKAELSRRLGCHLPQIDRLLDIQHASRLDQLEQALAAVGKRITLTVTDAHA